MLGGSLVEIEASDVSLYPTLECLVGWKLLPIDFLKQAMRKKKDLEKDANASF